VSQLVLLTETFVICMSLVDDNFCMVQVLFLIFCMCVCYKEFYMLANRLLLKDVKDGQLFVQLIRLHLPEFAKVIPSDIMPYLVSKNVIRLANFVTVLTVHMAAMSYTVCDITRFVSFSSPLSLFVVSWIKLHWC